MQRNERGSKDPYQTQVYPVCSLFSDETLMQKLMQLKASVCDINPALVKKCIMGTEQDYVLLMQKAKEYAISHFAEDADNLLWMFRECIFGYYILEPLIKDKHVSDIKVLSWNHIVVKADGIRYVADCSFFSRKDYYQWMLRHRLIQRVSDVPVNALRSVTDRKGSNEYYLRIDMQRELVTSEGEENIHIRKMPKEKLGWEYLMDNGMLDEKLLSYIRTRIQEGFGFLISGRGGSGKSTLLNNMIDAIPYDESVLVVQESDELYSNIHPQIQFEHTVTADGSFEGFSLEDELRIGLLQDIDNFVIGEIKGGEALYVFTTALSTGARFFGTIHSADAKSSVRRLAQCARYISDYPMETLEEMLTVTPFVLIHLSHFSIDEILEVDGFDDSLGRLRYKTVFERKEEDHE
ncbi:MAG: Flp pilus assembly complex ATPase component TadA [Lachnospiraceae bacterium]|nr:Flp pilus assembly complex ATPase component TadA [Lachnospiraceae bacterium]